MAIITNTRTTTLANLMSDAAALVVCRDALDICTMGSDVSFDFLNPLLYPGDALPAADAQLSSLYLMDAYIAAAGTGGTDGTYNLAITGGGGTLGAGTFTVTGGSVTAVSITANGSGYTGSPALSLAACPGLTGATVTPQMADAYNVAKNVQPAIGRTRRVGLLPQTYASRPTFNGKGLKFVNGTTCGMGIQKGGTASFRVNAPALEGFIDLFEAITVKPSGVPASGRALCSSTLNEGGININASNAPIAFENNMVLGPSLADAKMYTIGKRTRFNVAAGTSTVMGWCAYDGQVTQFAQAAGKAISAFATAPTSGGFYIGSQSGSVGTAFNGDVYHYYREYIGVSGRSDSDCADLVKVIAERAASRYA